MVPDSPVQTMTLNFMYTVKNMPPFWGSIVIMLIYSVSLVFCFPGTPINLAAGFLFGVYLGSFATVVGCDLGAVLAFFIGRSLTREWAEKQIKSNKRYSQIDTAVAKNGLLIIFLLRLSPVIPFGICNYIFGATKVKFSKYWLATTAGLIPCTVAYTYLGSLMRNLTEIYSDDSGEKQEQLIFISVATIFTVVIILVITIVTKRTLNRAMLEENSTVEMDDMIDLDLEKALPLILEEDHDGDSSSSSNSSLDNSPKRSLVDATGLGINDAAEYIIVDNSRVEREYTFESTNKRLD
ncbi:hypothetical protein SAMD00019534_073390 [Acytostelium subglobosum LB1]|uniref:hypothetical protein n=1 Tax=Acytostelium subglobosum LB1 TaxID=1410327 RepID=UPI000644D047|nr:hypothetical protein SAMD00019534_073390 [Acytostelium subglobosum LB1]GAM24164.1 hypothetical protein SAMD00019534_073390 [Acytostelium subglobosum LB1]|eukprot:XP_012753200.1 hypothetical protein SAMD00019534_073390 [Acytostelium subglobosum LB1]